MHLVTVLALAMILLMFSALISGANNCNKLAWSRSLLCSLNGVATVLAVAHNPEPLIKAYGREIANFALLYVLAVAAIVFITCIVVAIRWWLKRRTVEEPLYSTRRVGGVGRDGTWTAQLHKNGRPYGHVHVGSISALLPRKK